MNSTVPRRRRWLLRWSPDGRIFRGPF
jgi:hypothetical protein